MTEPKKIYERRSTDKGLGGKVVTIEERLVKGDVRMQNIEDDLAKNTAATKASAEAIKEVLEIVTLGKSFFKVLGLVGGTVKWAAGLATVVAAAYAAWSQK